MKNNCDIILLGSSVNKYTAKSDTDKRALSEMLNDIIPNKQVVGISHSAYQLDIFHEIIKHIVINKNDDTLTIIVPINLRSFAPQWDLRPHYQFVKEKYYFNGLPYVFNFKNYRKISKEEFEMHPIFFENKQIGTVEEFEDEETKIDSITDLKMGYISHYMQPIEEGNSKLLSLKEIDKISKHQNDLRIIFYITPIDIETAENIQVKRCREIIIRNIEIIKSEIMYSRFIDLSFYLNSQMFDYERRPNEHLNMYGKKELAKILSNECTDAQQ